METHVFLFSGQNCPRRKFSAIWNLFRFRKKNKMIMTVTSMKIRIRSVQAHFVLIYFRNMRTRMDTDAGSHVAQDVDTL